jgi:hypothetical protein
LECGQANEKRGTPEPRREGASRKQKQAGVASDRDAKPQRKPTPKADRRSD